MNEFFKMFPPGSTFQNIFRGSRDSFEAKAFHAKVDNQGAFVAVIVCREHKKTFGAYTDIPLSSSGGSK